MPLNLQAKKNIIKKVITNQDYREEVLILIDELFLDYCIRFLKEVIYAKIDNLGVNEDWYQKNFLQKNDLSKEAVAINSGLNMKSINNAHKSIKREIVIEAANENYLRLTQTINELIYADNNLEVKLTLKIKDVSVDLTVTESLIVINALAVKRSEIRGGMWSSVGKQVEKPLMVTLCKIFNVPFSDFDQTNNPKSFREVDFYILSKDNIKLRTEVKLMGKGNPESADAIFAREPKIFVADTLSAKNKQQAEKLGVEWVALREDGGFNKFQDVLKKLNVQNSNLTGDLNKRIDQILDEIFTR